MSQIINLTLQLKQLEKEKKHAKPKASFGEKKSQRIEQKKKSMKTIARINNTKRGLQESIKKIMSHTHQQNRENVQINKVRHEKGAVISDATEISKDHKRLQQTSLSQ